MLEEIHKWVNFVGGEMYRSPEPEPISPGFSACIGRGDVRPLLSMPELSEIGEQS